MSVVPTHICNRILHLLIHFVHLSLQIIVWVSSVSFHAYTDISYESTSDVSPVKINMSKKALSFFPFGTMWFFLFSYVSWFPVASFREGKALQTSKLLFRYP